MDNGKQELSCCQQHGQVRHLQIGTGINDENEINQ